MRCEQSKKSFLIIYHMKRYSIESNTPVSVYMKLLFQERDINN